MVEIKDKNGSVVFSQNTLTYNGNFMGERSVSCSVQSPTVLPFQSGCYVDYRGERFTLDKTPSPTIKKISSENSVGNAFQYELKFISLHFELQNVAFRDLVLNDSTNYYSGTTDVEFTGTVDYLLNRIQACLDEVYFGDKKWTIELEDGVLTSTEKIKATNISCFDALALVNSTENWKLNYKVTGRNIKVGYSVDRISKSFEYGKGNGLYELSRNVVESESIVTRLRAYGASTNISSDYKRETGATGRVCPDSQYVTKLMLPSYAYIDGQFVHANSKGIWNNSTAYSKGDLVLYSNNIRYYCIQNSYSGVLPTDPLYFTKWPDDFIDSPNISKYGIREGVFTDESIFPTISGITIRELEVSGAIDSETGSADRVDEILASSKVPVDIKNAANNQSYFYVWIRNIGFDISKSILSASSPTLELIDTPTGLGGFSFEITSVKEDTTSYAGSKYRLTLKRNTTESSTIPNSDSNIYLNDDGVNFIPNGIYAHFVLTGIELPFAYVKISENRLLESAQNYLTKHDSPLSTYSLSVDEIEMARNRNDIHQSIHEGQSIGIFDENVECGSRIISNIVCATSEHPRWNDSESDIIFGIDLLSMNIVPSGSRYASFLGIGENAIVWTSDMYDADNAVAKKISFDSSEFSNTFLNKHTGASVVAVRYANDGELSLEDGTVRSGVYTDVDGNVYDGVKIGDKIWLNKFIKTTKYSKETENDSIIFNGYKYVYKGVYSGSNTYVIDDCVIDGGSYFRKANDGVYSPSNVPYGQEPAWYEFPNYPQTYHGEYNSSIGYQIGAIVLRNGVKYFKSKPMPIPTDPADTTDPNHVGWVVFVSNPYVVIDRLISGLSDSNWVSANYGAVCSYPYPVGNLSSESQVVNSYGRLYNHYAVENTLGLISDENGFRIPSLADFSSLENYIKSKFPSESSFGIGNVLKSKFQVNSPFDSSFKEVKIHQYIPIQTLTIKEGFGAIPTYDVTLSTAPVASTLNAISNSVKSNSASIANNSSKITSVSNSISKSIVEVKSSLPSTPADTGSEPAILPKQNGILSWLNSSWVFLEDVFVRNTRKINGKTLADDITLTTLDISENTNKRYQSDLQLSVNDATSSIQTQINSKQTKLPFPETPTGDTFLNDLGLFSAPPSTGGSASGTPLYFLPTNSPTSGFLELGYAPYSSTVEIPYSIPVGTTHLSSHLYDLGLATTNIDAGNWFISSRSKVNNLSGSVKLHVDFFLYHTDGTKTILFGGDSEIFSTTEFKVYSGQLPEASFTCVATDRIGVDIYAVNSGGATKTLTTSLGAGIATFFSTPLRERHSSLRDKNGEASFQHVTTDQISTWNAKQPALYGVGFVKANGSTISYDPQTYLTVEALSPYSTTAQSNALYEPKFAQGYTNQYLRGDKTWQLFPTTLSSFTNDLGNYGGWITGINSSMVTTALGYTPWHSGNHPTTVSGYGITDIPTYSGVNFIQNQNSSAQSANMWISGNVKALGLSLKGNLDIYTYNSLSFENIDGTSKYDILHATSGKLRLTSGNSFTELLNIIPSGAATFASTVNATGFLLNGNNLTSSLSTNCLPKWNGSNFINSYIYNNESTIGIRTSSPHYDVNIVGDAFIANSDNTVGVTIHSTSANAYIYSDNFFPGVEVPLHLGTFTNRNSQLVLNTNGSSAFGGTVSAPSFSGSLNVYAGNESNISNGFSGGTVYINYRGASSAITEYKICNGLSNSGLASLSASNLSGTNTGDGAVNSNYVNDYRASNFVAGTNYQAPITLTTNGTSGAATFSGNVLNVPNYAISSTIPTISISSGDYTATNSDCFIKCGQSAGTHLYLPASPVSGKYLIIKCRGYAVTIHGNGNYIFDYNVAQGNPSSVNQASGVCYTYVWSGDSWDITTTNYHP